MTEPKNPIDLLKSKEPNGLTIESRPVTFINPDGTSETVQIVSGVHKTLADGTIVDGGLQEWRERN